MTKHQRVANEATRYTWDNLGRRFIHPIKVLVRGSEALTCGPLVLGFEDGEEASQESLVLRLAWNEAEGEWEVLDESMDAGDFERNISDGETVVEVSGEEPWR